MSKLFEEMAQGTSGARAYMEGDRKGYKVTLLALAEAQAPPSDKDAIPSRRSKAARTDAEPSARRGATIRG